MAPSRHARAYVLPALATLLGRPWVRSAQRQAQEIEAQ